MSRLTRAEVRALWAAAQSRTRQDAADLLGRSPNTLDKHLTIAFRVLDAGDAPEAWRRLGWLRVPSLEQAIEDVAAVLHGPGPVSPDVSPLPGDRHPSEQGTAGRDDPARDRNREETP